MINLGISSWVKTMGILTEIFDKDGGPKVLDYFLSHPKALLVHHRIEKKTKLSYSTVKRILAELLAKEIITELQIGARRVYRLNTVNHHVKDMVSLYPTQESKLLEKENYR